MEKETPAGSQEYQRMTLNFSLEISGFRAWLHIRHLLPPGFTQTLASRAPSPPIWSRVRERPEPWGAWSVCIREGHWEDSAFGFGC